MKDTSLLFLHNEMLNPEIQQNMSLPIQFISFAYVFGRLHSGKEKHTTSNTASRTSFITPDNNKITHGAIFLLPDAYFYFRLIDAFFNCSLSTLRVNHNLDLNHRVIAPATPIKYNNLSEFSRLMYEEGEPIQVCSYYGNVLNKNILNKTKRSGPYRLSSGVDKEHYIKLYNYL